MDLLKGLNQAQAEAVMQTDGPVLILAGAGSGKTKTLTHRIAYILENNLAQPHNILAVTFTNKAAREMRQRVAVLVGENPESRAFMPYMSTFHSICVRILRQEASEAGLDPRFVIFDESDRSTLIKQIMQAQNINEKQYSPRTVGHIISSNKNELVDPAEFASLASDPLQKIVARVYPLYEKGLRDASALDFDDLIGRTVHMLASNERVRIKLQEQFRYVMIDEYQDTNAAQYKLIKLLLNPSQNLCVVGDDWQSIYSWRGADFRNILNFERDYPKAKIIKLEQNYRSTSSILEAADKIIRKNAQRSDKKLWTDLGEGRPVSVLQAANERAEGEIIARNIARSSEMRARNYRDYAVLYRTNAQSRVLEEMFMRLGIPYKIYGGLRFYDRKEIKDIIAYVRFIFQPEDSVSFERIVNVPARSIGGVSLNRFSVWRTSNNFSLLEALASYNDCPGLPAKAKAGFADIFDIAVSFREQMDSMPVADFLEALIKRISYYKYLDDGTVQGDARIENVKELLGVAKAYADNNLAGFLEEVALVSDTDNEGKSDNAVTLMTLHSAKGLEFPVVYMVGMEEGIFPHSRALMDPQEMEEERRLAYVGMTRAREELNLLYATSRALYGSVQYNPPSSFIRDLDGVKDSAGGTTLSFTAVTANEPRYVPDLEVGDGVNHPVFGKGVVQHIEGDSADIMFAAKGMKKLNIAFAPLEKI